jgi:hypothetical protein
MYFYETDGGNSGTDNYANRFYNQAFDTAATIGANNSCYETGGWRQDFKQCTTLSCNPPGGGGGGGPVCYCDPNNPDPNCCGSPIILDVSGKGFVLTSAQEGVKFDIAGTGHPVQIAWIAQGADNAFLCLPDANGMCDDGKDLFGNFTPQPPSSTPNGFAALAVYDQPANGGNGDGVIDSHDAIFSSLRLWIDANHDGVSQPNEIYTLPQLGIAAISLDYKRDDRTDQYGNVFRYRAKVRSTSDDVGRWAYDVFFVRLNPASAKLKPNSDKACPVPKVLSRTTGK